MKESTKELLRQVDIKLLTAEDMKWIGQNVKEDY